MPSDPEFYVGYLPSAPAGVARLRRRVVSALLCTACVLGLALALSQREFSAGYFDFFQTQAYEGRLSERPYPTLTKDGGARLLVGAGKFGAEPETAGLEGRLVRLQGKSIRLGAREMVEVAPGSLAALGAGPAAPPDVDLGAFTLEGEIVDSKCYFGVMNPGRGKVHKGCAVRCISGGAPPAFLVKDEAGTPVVLVLTDTEGRAVRDAVLPLVGRGVRLTGRIRRSEGLLYFGADLSSAQVL